MEEEDDELRALAAEMMREYHSEEEDETKNRNTNEGAWTSEEGPKPAEKVTQACARAAVVVHVEPAQGPLDGGNAVRIYGVHFRPSERLLARFGAVRVVPSYEADDTLRCVVPAGIVAGPVAVEVALDGATFTTDGVLYTYLAGGARSPGQPIVAPGDYAAGWSALAGVRGAAAASNYAR
jgi:hypothetical protein